MISIIMGVYNGEAFLKEQLDSILMQDFTDWNLFLFDDGSTDRTEEIVRTYVKSYPSKINYIKNKTNYGAKGNFFQGLSKVFLGGGEYFAFADQDDVWESNKLSLSIKKMKEMEGDGSEPAVIFSDVRLTDEGLNELASSYFKAAGLRKDRISFASLLMENKAIGGTMLLNRALIEIQRKAEERRGGYPKKAKMHDWWFALIGASMGRVGFLPEITESYRQHGGNVVGGEGFLSYVNHRLSSFSEIKKRLLENISQGEEFFLYFQEELSEEKMEVLSDFLCLREAGFLQKRKLIWKRGFYKSGFLRNVALFIFI